jgi:hypothetical protein
MLSHFVGALYRWFVVMMGQATYKPVAVIQTVAAMAVLLDVWMTICSRDSYHSTTDTLIR